MITQYFSAIILLTFFFSNKCLSQETSESYTHSNSTLRFIENKGQVATPELESRPDVLFQVEGKGIYIRNAGISYVKLNYAEAYHEAHEKVEEIEDSPGGLGHKSEPQLLMEFLAQEKISMHQIDVDFVGMNSNFNLVKSQQSEDHLNYYLRQCPLGVNGVKMYNSLTYNEIYKGIDMTLYGGAKNRFKYDFVIAPKANPDQILMQWTGADSLSLDESGDLIIHNQIEDFKESIPAVYQLVGNDTVFIKAQYNLKKGGENNYLVSFKLGEYNENRSLIIDPWITLYGGEESDFFTSTCEDAFGNIISSGYTNSSTIVGVGGYIDAINGAYDAIIAQFDTDGNRVWGTYYGGEQQDVIWETVADNLGNIYVAGVTSSETVVASLGGFQPVKDFGNDAFMVKFDNDGNRVWGTYYGGESFDYGYGLEYHEDHLYLVGEAISTTNIAEDGYLDAPMGGSDAFLAKFTLDGDRVWGTYYGGVEFDSGTSVTLDDAGNIYLLGVTGSPDFIAEDGFDETLAMPWGDMFLVKFDPDLNRVWGTYIGGNDIERGLDIVVDEFNDIYLTGYAHSLEDIASPGAFQTVKLDSEMSRDGFLLKFNTDGDRLWGTYIGGSDNDYMNSLAIDPETNNIILSGDTYSVDFPVTECAERTELVGSENGVIVQMTPEGELYCSSYFGFGHVEDANVFIRDCKIYVSGGSIEMIATPGSYQEYHGGGILDCFVAEMFKSNCGLELPELLISSEVIPSESCDPCDGELSVTVEFDCPSIEAFIDFRWSTGFEELNTLERTSSIAEICDGEFWVEITTNCDHKDTVFFDLGEELALVDANFEIAGNCENETWVFTDASISESGEIVSYNWTFGDGENSTDINPTHNYNEPGTYEVTLVVENESGCTDEYTTTITVYPTYTATQDYIICEDSLFIFPDGTSEIITNDLTHNSVLATANGCDSSIVTNIVVSEHYKTTDTLYVNPGDQVSYPDNSSEIIQTNTVHISDLPPSFYCDSIIETYVFVNTTFYVPNSFTPDGDQYNNTFQPVFTAGIDVYDYQLRIFNRWGEILFESYDPAIGWDGTYGNKGLVQDGVYVWQLIFGDLNTDQKYTHNGHVSLVR